MSLERNGLRWLVKTATALAVSLAIAFAANIIHAPQALSAPVQTTHKSVKVNGLDIFYREA